jgi:hypothetical protein
VCARVRTREPPVAEDTNMNDSWLKRLVILVIVLMVLHAVGSWVYAALGAVAAMISAVLVAAVSVFSARMAGRGQGNNAWFVVPTLVFTVLPLAARLWTLVNVEQGWWARTVEFAPFLIGFTAPVLLLLAAYLELGRRTTRAARPLPGAGSGALNIG